MSEQGETLGYPSLMNNHEKMSGPFRIIANILLVYSVWLGTAPCSYNMKFHFNHVVVTSMNLNFASVVIDIICARNRSI